ncbi:Transposon TX1 uncharacterized protein [Merluccius polli]|uniref:Transposon TX1 uncharacterized protein n=1 Tax=Merluccius polli TaxID=89951 RepID=A0AA47NBY9_MERPO|nr:Transposon TX1 uncharacterized protein [Merluccius polli]
MSYRGRALIINNLVSSSLWHRLACVDPPPNLLSRIQAMLVNFFWDKLHWIPQAVLYLPKDEGGQGLVHLASRGAAFRLQFIQRLLHGPKDLVWRPLAHMILQRFAGLGLKDSLFLMDLSIADLHTLPPFYRGAFTVWKMMAREKNTVSLHWLLQELVVFGGQLSAPLWAGTALRDIFCQARVTTLESVVHLAGAGLQDAAALAAGVGIRSVRSIGRLLEHWRGCLSGHQRILLSRHSQGFIAPCTDDPFPPVTLRPVFKDCTGWFLNSQQCTLSLQEATGKVLYRVIVKCLNGKTLNRVDTPWRGHLQLGDEVTPAWRSLYKGPLTRKVADLQWRVLHGILAVNSFLSIIVPGHTDRCVFCGERETVFHCYTECARLTPLFTLLKSLFRAAGEEFSVQVFILGFKYRKAAESKCKLLNFILGQAKMAVHVSRKRKEEDMLDVDVSLLFCRMVKARVHIDFKYYSQMQDMDQFIKTWTHSNTLVEDVSLAVGDQVGHSSIKSAARMNGATVIFLDQVGKVNQIIEAGLTVNEMFVQVLPLAQPATKLYMILNKRNEELNLRFIVKVEDYEYVIFATSSVMKCFACGEEGHAVRACPRQGDPNPTGPGGTDGAGEGPSVPPPGVPGRRGAAAWRSAPVAGSPPAAGWLVVRRKERPVAAPRAAPRGAAAVSDRVHRVSNVNTQGVSVNVVREGESENGVLGEMEKSVVVGEKEKEVRGNVGGKQVKETEHSEGRKEGKQVEYRQKRKKRNG